MLSKGGPPRRFWDMISFNFNYILINYACFVYMKHWIPINFAWINWFRKNLFFQGDDDGNIWSEPFLHWFLNTFLDLSMYWMWLGVNRRSRSLQIERNISIDICQGFKLSFLLMHIISGRNKVDLRLKSALSTLNFSQVTGRAILRIWVFR